MCRWFYSSFNWSGWCSWTDCGLPKTTRAYILCAQEVAYNERLSVHRFPPKYLGFEATLRSLPENINDKVAPVARIGLQFSVQTHIESKHNVAYKENKLRLLYLYLKAADEAYALLNNITEFNFFDFMNS